MAVPIIFSNSVVAVNVEATENTYVAPASATDGYIQPNESGLDMKQSFDSVERPVMNSGLGKMKSQRGMAKVTGTIPMEVKGQGVEGTEPNIGVVLRSLFGSKHQVTANVTTKSSGNSGTNLKIEDADIANFVVNDIVIIEQTSAYDFAVVTAVDATGGAANITVFPGKTGGGNYANSVVISKSTTYKPANSGHPSYSVSEWLGNAILKKGMGCRTSSMSLDNFQTGKIASLKFGFEGLSFDEIAQVSPYTPTYENALPPVVLGATVYIAGVAVNVPQVSLNVAQPLSFLEATGNSNGRFSGRASGERTITGSLAPYKDDTSVTNFTNWKNNTDVSILLTVALPDPANAGQFLLGNCFAIYLPQVRIVDKTNPNFQGAIQDSIQFEAHAGVTGQTPEIAVAII